VSLKFTPDGPSFLQKIYYNSNDIRDRPIVVHLAPKRGFSRSSNLLVSLKFTPDFPLLPGNQKLRILKQNEL